MPIVRPDPPPSDRLRLSYLFGGVATYLPGESFGPRVIFDYEIVWIISGQVVYHQDQNQHDAPPGSVILSRPGFHERYVWDPERKTRHAFFHFSIERSPSDWPAPAQWPICRKFASGSAVLSIFQHLMAQQHAERPRSRRPERSVERMAEAMFDAFIREPVVPDAASASRHPLPVKRALEWMSALVFREPDRVVTLDDVAAAANVSPKHLCRLFASSLDITPMEALRLLRLEQAVALLARSNLTIKEIANRSGFASPYHFSRCFSKVYGSSPSEVLKQLKAGSPPPTGPMTLAMGDEFV